VSAPRRFEQLLAGGGGLDAVSALQYIDMETYLPDDILAKVDWTSMAISLESRIPLLDHRLLEFVATIPSSLKLVGGAGKHILKGAMSSRLAAASSRVARWASACRWAPGSAMSSTT